MRLDNDDRSRAEEDLFFNKNIFVCDPCAN
jgi:hypothetical protein